MPNWCKSVDLREAIFPRIRSEWQASIDALLRIMDHQKLLEFNPLLERSIRNRFPYLDPLNIFRLNCSNCTAQPAITQRY